MPAATRPLAPSQPRPSRWPAPVVWSVLVLGVGLLLFTYRHLEHVAGEGKGAWLPPFINELTGAVGGGLVVLALIPLVRARPLGAGRWLAHLPLHMVAVLVLSAFHTTLNWGLRQLLFPLAGLPPYDYGKMPLRYLMELPVDVLIYAVAATLVTAFDRLEEARARELRTAQLESSLARTELRTLRLQLQPHFLFNALNTISSTMYRDPEAADEMLDRLAHLLRASLRSAEADEVTLEEEGVVLDAYLAIMRARFGERLTVETDVPAELGSLRVPSMLLQPLVENAVRHGRLEGEGRCRIAVRARRLGERLRLEVADDGPGCDDSAIGKGVGLRSTVERLALLYGDAARLDLQRRDGGFTVCIELPAASREAA